jgi:hypothetical protein
MMANYYQKNRNLGFAMCVGGVFAGPVAYELLSTFMSKGVVLEGIAWTVCGITLVAADIICRYRETEPSGIARYFSPDAGGVIKTWPIWFLGAGIIILGILYSLGLLS